MTSLPHDTIYIEYEIDATKLLPIHVSLKSKLCTYQSNRKINIIMDNNEWPREESAKHSLFVVGSST